MFHSGCACLLRSMNDQIDGKVATITITVTNFTFGSAIEEQASPPYAVPDVPINAFLSRSGPFPAMEAWQEKDSNTHFDTGVRAEPKT
jgi:hypothetical protein